MLNTRQKANNSTLGRSHVMGPSYLKGTNMIYTVTLNTAVDRIVQIDGILTRKANNKTKHAKYDIGGKATHVSVALSAMGIENIATGVVGGLKGELMVNLMKAKGVNCHFFDQPGAQTRESIILVDESGQGSYMITEKGFELSPSSIKQLVDFLSNNVTSTDIVVFAGSPPPGFSLEQYESLLAIVKKNQAKLVVDASGDFLTTALKQQPYLVKPNEFEFQEFVGKKLHSIDDFIEELQSLKTNIDIWIVSLGKRGSIAKYKDHIYVVTPPEVKEVNETGAGDFYVSGLVAKIYQEDTIENTLLFASAVGASKAMQTESSNFDLEQVNEIIKKCEMRKI